MKMHILTANEAKTQFGDLLLKAQREPVQITRNGKPVAVVVSAEDYEQIEAMKLQLLQMKIQRSQHDMAIGNAVDGETFFSELLEQAKG
jgi:prevent-host-death family protein